MTDGDAAAPGPHGQKGIKRRMAYGFVAKMFAVGVYFAQQFLLVPLFLHYFGADLYRDWLALFSTASFLMLLDFGLQSTLSNVLLMRWSQGDRDGFQRTLRMGLGAYATLLLALLPVAVAVALTTPWAATLKLEAGSATAAEAVMIMLAVHMLATIPIGMVINVYRARGDIALGIMISAFQMLLLSACVAAALALGAGLAGLGIVYLVVPGVIWLWMIADQRRRYPDLRHGFAWPRRDELRMLVGTGPFYAIIPAAFTLTVHGTVLLIAGLGSGAGVVVYTTLRTMTGIGRQVTEQLGHVAGAEMSRQFAQADFAALQRLYAFLGKLFGGINGAIAGLIAVIGPAFLAIWTLGKVEIDPVVFWGFLAWHMLAAPGRVAENLLMFINRPRKMAMAHLARGVLGIALCAALIPGYGAGGAVIAVLIAELATVGVIVPRAAAEAARAPVLEQYGRTYLSAALSLALGYGVAYGIATALPPTDLWRLLAVGAIWTAAMGLPAFFILLTGEQRGWMMRRLRRKPEPAGPV